MFPNCDMRSLLLPKVQRATIADGDVPRPACIRLGQQDCGVAMQPRSARHAMKRDHYQYRRQCAAGRGARLTRQLPTMLPDASDRIRMA